MLLLEHSESVFCVKILILNVKHNLRTMKTDIIFYKNVKKKQGVYSPFFRKRRFSTFQMAKTLKMLAFAGSAEIARKGPLTMSSRRVFLHHFCLARHKGAGFNNSGHFAVSLALKFRFKASKHDFRPMKTDINLFYHRKPKAGNKLCSGFTN